MCIQQVGAEGRKREFSFLMARCMKLFFSQLDLAQIETLCQLQHIRPKTILKVNIDC